MKRRRLSDALTDLAARTYPRSRRADVLVVRDCAREAIDHAGSRVLIRECLSLVGGGLRVRAGVAASDLWHAPWGEALTALTLPLATAILLLWTFGFVPRYDHWPLGEGWMLLLGGSLLAVIGAALSERRLAAAGAIAVFVAAASPYVGMGTENALADTPSFFQGYSIDLGAASLLPTLLLVAGALSLPRRRPGPRRVVEARLAAGLLPAIVAAIALLPETTPEPTYTFLYEGPGVEPTITVGEPSPWPWIMPSRTLVTLLAIALAVAIVATWRDAKNHPERVLATGLVLASVAYPVAWLGIRDVLPSPYWLYNGAYPLLVATVPLVLALVLVRRAGRLQPR